MMQLLSSSKALATGQRSPEKLFKVLDMYESLQDLLPKIENIFSGVSGASPKSEASGILLLLEEAATGTFTEFGFMQAIGVMCCCFVAGMGWVHGRRRRQFGHLLFQQVVQT
jgi:exocyst complex protein 7